MADKTDEKLTKAINVLADRITGDIKSDDALRFTQAALNLAHLGNVLANTEGLREPKT